MTTYGEEGVWGGGGTDREEGEGKGAELLGGDGDEEAVAHDGVDDGAEEEDDAARHESSLRIQP